MNRLLVTVDSLRADHLQHMPATRRFLSEFHDRAFSTSTATMGSFPAIVGGTYPEGSGLPAGTSVGTQFNGYCAGITTNHLLSPRYGYDEGFDKFDSPRGDGNSLKDKGAVILKRGTLPYRAASWGWSQYQRFRSKFGGISKSFRRAPSVINEFCRAITDVNGWFGWLHFMEPHHPYDPDGADVDRATAQSITRRVLAGNGDSEEEALVRSLYKREVRELDEQLEPLWNTVPDDTRIVFCADHGELLGEDSQWGHPGIMREELLNVPFGTRNAPELGDVVSLIDVPTILRGEPHGDGTLHRNVAFATYGDEKAAMNADRIATADGTRELYSTRVTEDTELKRAYDRFDPETVVKEDAMMEDLEDLGYV